MYGVILNVEPSCAAAGIGENVRIVIVTAAVIETAALRIISGMFSPMIVTGWNEDHVSATGCHDPVL
jgi:hypothetical protein